MKNLFYTIIAIVLCLSATLWYGCDDKNKESEFFGSIYGMVSEAGTAEPMRGTGVELYYLNEKGTAGALLLRTTTADDGSYSFDDVKAGEYLLRVEIPGYKRTEYKVVVESNRTARADMQVKPKGDGYDDDEETDTYYIIAAAQLMVQKEDLGYGLWWTADEMCKNLTLAGYSDWRLPTKEELKMLYNKNSLIGFEPAKYWSMSYDDGDTYDYYYYLDFENGNIDRTGGGNNYHFRAVRNINPITPTEPYIILSVVNLMVQTEDLGRGNRGTAEAMCEASTLAGYTDWRLPTEEELMVLYSNRNLIGGFLPNYYWSSYYYRYNGNSYAYEYINFKNGESGSCPSNKQCRIRAVRTITE